MTEQAIKSAAEPTLIDSRVFNTKKSDYENTPLFLGDEPGIMDSINRTHQIFTTLRKRLKAQDWDENEFNFSSCAADFKDESNVFAAGKMVKVIAWQWESDTVAARHLIPVVAPFVSNSDLWNLWVKIGENETVHALTYSEIVRESFPDSQQALAEILAMKEPLQRMKVVADVFATTMDVGDKLRRGEISRQSNEAFDAIFMFVAAMFCLERIQFMASFAVTFAIAKTGIFVPIGKAVQKICADEYEIHVEANRAILNILLGTGEGIMAFNRCRDKIATLIDEVIESEFASIDWIHEDGHELAGATPDLLKGWVMNCAQDPLDFFGLKSQRPFQGMPKLGYMKDWMSIDQVQASPQEEKTSGYLLGYFLDDCTDEVEFDILN
jgi:ribonucleoside-diphosphate reductase beta chain